MICFCEHKRFRIQDLIRHLLLLPLFIPNILLDIRHGICPKFYTADFQAKNFTPPISPNFNSCSKKTLPKALRTQALTTLTSKFG